MSKKSSPLFTLIFVVAFLSVAPSATTSVQQPVLRGESSCKPLVAFLAELDSLAQRKVAADEVVVAGHVYHPQTIKIRETLSLYKILAAAGGMRLEATTLVYVMRESSKGKKREKIEVDLKKQGEAGEAQFMLAGGEMVYVPAACQMGEPQRYGDPPRTIDPSIVKQRPR